MTMSGMTTDGRSPAAAAAWAAASIRAARSSRIIFDQMEKRAPDKSGDLIPGGARTLDTKASVAYRIRARTKYEPPRRRPLAGHQLAYAAFAYEAPDTAAATCPLPGQR